VAAPGIGSAQSTSDKIEQKADKAIDKVKEVGREAKADVSDSWLTAKTKIALFSDERVKGRQVTVETQKGTVFLRGKVDSPDAKTTAEAVAKTIDGVKSVKNDLQVVPPGERKMTDTNDKDIAKSVSDRLAREPQLKKISVRSDAGVVTLTGEVPSLGASARASEVAYGMPGVRAVKNEVTFREASMSDRRTERMSERRAARASATGEDTYRFDQHTKMMQQALRDKGYDPGPVDGIQGPRTTPALKSYQQSENLDASGRADAETLGKLGIGIGGATTSMPASQKKTQAP
jgi:hyperosmotically inducible protein